MIATTVLYLIWGIVIGIFQVIGAIQMRRVIDNEWFLIITGIGAVIWAILVSMLPGWWSARDNLDDRRPRDHVRHHADWTWSPASQLAWQRHHTERHLSGTIVPGQLYYR